ncbi:MAG: CoA-binding protein [Bacteroidales bacterium]|nr:CoA-binding protein [Bacteroidales bacterium]MBN2699501.1 CoA-binding protein [Bacteroidales bacterium]
MKNIIRDFIGSKKIAIVGTSENTGNWGKSLMDELIKKGYEIIPVNPGCEQIGGVKCYASVKDLPPDIESVIIAVPPLITEQIIDEMDGTKIKRVWMHRGAGKGAYSEKAKEICKKNRIDVVYGFCPMMFFGDGFHRFHLWIRNTFGKLPPEYKLILKH